MRDRDKERLCEQFFQSSEDNRIKRLITRRVYFYKSIEKSACHREQFVNKSSFGLTGIVLWHIIRKIVYIGKAVCYDDQRPYIYKDQRT